MKSIKLSLSQPLREVRLVPAAGVGGAGNVATNEAAEKAAYERGRMDAEKLLREQMMQQRSELAVLQKGILQSLRSSSTQVVQQSEALLVDLALEVARRLVAGISITPDMVSGSIREALDQVETSTEITVQIHPDDLALLQQIAEADRPGAELPEPIRLHPNPSIERGGCLVQTRFGLIDNQRETKLRHLKESLAA